MWVKMCSKEFGITPRKIGSDRTPKDQRKWTAIIVIWIFKLANQLTAFWNNLLASCTSRALFKDIQSRNGSNITCNITFHGECFSCPSLSISKYCAWQGKSASYIINPPTKSSSTCDQGHHVVVLSSPFISFYPRVNPTIRFSHVLLQEHLPMLKYASKAT